VLIYFPSLISTDNDGSAAQARPVRLAVIVQHHAAEQRSATSAVANTGIWKGAALAGPAGGAARRKIQHCADGLRLRVGVAGSKPNLEDGARNLTDNQHRAPPGKESRCISVSGR